MIIKKEKLTTKDIVIEEENGIVVRDWIVKRKIRFGTFSELVRELLKRYKRKTIDFKPYKLRERKQRRVYLDVETLSVYLGIEVGGRAYIVNGLLRNGIKENENKLK